MIPKVKYYDRQYRHIQYYHIHNIKNKTAMYTHQPTYNTALQTSSSSLKRLYIVAIIIITSTYTGQQAPCAMKLNRRRNEDQVLLVEGLSEVVSF